MSPIAEGATCLDLAGDLGLPVVLVAGAYLGAVSHTLTALAAIEGRGLTVAAVVVNAAAPDAMQPAAIATELAPFTDPRRVMLWRRDQTDADAALLDRLTA